jgi:uncharacterized UPF0146 family protein
MGEYKHIETCIGEYIAAQYDTAVEIGVGKNTTAALIITGAGKTIRCTDICEVPMNGKPAFAVDDIFDPDPEIYQGTEVIYAIRPAVEMVPPMIALAKRVNADLLIYHLGFECYEDGGERIDCGVVLHRYYRRQNPSRSVC